MSQHIHILGICGTFMGGLALLARDLGYRVTGSDANIYPPMSTQLAQSGIELFEGYSPEQLALQPDLVVVGNAMARGNPVVEALLDSQIPYTSGPQWLGEHVLANKWVLAVAGTHGKTTTTSLLSWILDYAGMAPGFLVGGIPADFGCSARLGASDFFVIEADEYDTAFFDKRSKFIHYHPRTLVMGNVEYDHADIFPDLAAIETQFHHLIRCVPASGAILCPPTESVTRILARGVWTPVQSVSVDAVSAGDWQAECLTPSGSEFLVRDPSGVETRCVWGMLGKHNVANACSAIAAACHVGVPPIIAAEAIATFSGVKRRLELRGEPGGVRIYDDFAHHPTAIAATLASLRADDANARLIAVIELRSNTMRSGVHGSRLADSAATADRVYWYQSGGLDEALSRKVIEGCDHSSVFSDTETLVEAVADYVRAGDNIVIMSNGGFEGVHERLLAALG